MHAAFKANGGTTFHYSSDMSGEVMIVDSSKKELFIPAQDILDFVASYVRAHMIATTEAMTTNMILFGGEFSDAGSGDSG